MSWMFLKFLYNKMLHAIYVIYDCLLTFVLQNENKQKSSTTWQR